MVKGRAAFALMGVALASGCSDRHPTEPGEVAALAVESISAFITAGDYRNYFIRIRVHDTSATPMLISRITLQFAGGGVGASRAFSNIPNGTIPAGQSVELDDLVVSDEQRELDQAQTISATIAYGAATVPTATATGTTTIPTCFNRFGVTGPAAVNVGQSGQMSGSLTFGCQPNFLPLSPSQIEWQSLNPGIAAVDRSGIVTGRASGVATIQGRYGVPVASHALTVGR